MWAIEEKVRPREDAQLSPHGKRGSGAQVERTCVNMQTLKMNIPFYK